MNTLPVLHRVLARLEETPDTVTLELQPAGGEDPLPFRAGQFAMLYAFGVGEIPVSVAGVPHEYGLLVHTVRAVGAVSRALHGLRTGDVVGVRGPYGTGWQLPRTAGDDVLVVAGGIGLAPLRPLIVDVLSRPRHYGHRTILVGVRTPADTLYRPQLRAWNLTGDLAVTVDRPTAGWRGRTGLVTELLDRARFRPAATSAFVCGPEPMIRATAPELTQRGMPPGRVQVSLERNMRCGVGTCGHCQLGPVLLCRDGPVLSWDRAQSLLSVAEL